jgi:Uma2 family endonuclease
VEELVLIASDGVHAELHRRSGAQWFTEILRGGDAVLALTSVGIEVQLGQLYEGIALPDAE